MTGHQRKLIKVQLLIEFQGHAQVAVVYRIEGATKVALQLQHGAIPTGLLANFAVAQHDILLGSKPFQTYRPSRMELVR